MRVITKKPEWKNHIMFLLLIISFVGATILYFLTI